MYPKESRERQEKLSNEIYELSMRVLNKEENEHLGSIHRLQMIYQDSFKHSYSDFFPVLSKIFEEDNEYNVEYLMTNLETIRIELEEDYNSGKHEFKDIYEKFTKLCDHINLQISQTTYFFSNASKINDANVKIQQANKDLLAAQNALDKANEQTKSLQTELIAVLSIFAAIVITFSGGLSFLGSVMASINLATYYEMIVLMAIICGIIIYNTIFLMMYLVSKIIKRNIYARCLTSECSCDDPKCKCGGLKRVRRRLPYVYYFNAVAVVGIIIDCVVWFFDMRGWL